MTNYTSNFSRVNTQDVSLNHTFQLYNNCSPRGGRSSNVLLPKTYGNKSTPHRWNVPTPSSLSLDEIQSVTTQSTSCVLAEINAKIEMQDRKINEMNAKLDRNFEHLQLPNALYSCTNRGSTENNNVVTSLSSFNESFQGDYTEKWINQNFQSPPQYSTLDTDYGINSSATKLKQCQNETIFQKINEASSERDSTNAEENSKCMNNNQILPDRYTGRTPLNDYLVHFEICSEINQWSTLEKAQYLAISLKGKAQKVLSVLTKKELSNYETLKSALKHRFAPTDQSDLFYEKLQYRVKRSDETYPDLADNIYLLVKEAYPSASVDKVNVMTCHYFIKAIKEIVLREHIALRKPDHVNDAVQIAVDFERKINGLSSETNESCEDDMFETRSENSFNFA